MANNPKKAQDATEAAMAAIQEALNVRDAEMKSSGSKPLRSRRVAIRLRHPEGLLPPRCLGRAAQPLGNASGK